MPLTQIGRYELLREIGRGGMSTVYLARDPSFRRRVAIKVLPASYIHAEDMRGRFVREARVIAALDHANIVPVYDYGEDNEQPFIVMRYMPGGTLADRIAGQPIPLAQAVPIVQRVAEALAEAHAQGIIHRDLKPANVMFDGRGQAFLSDFGLAKFFEGGGSVLTVTGVMGTPAYMSPEQALDEDLDGRSDIYSLGVMVYEMLAGRQMYEAKTPAALMIKHVMVITPQMDTQALGLPPECNAVLARALAKDRKDRYPTPLAFAADLAALTPSTALIVRPNFAPQKRKPAFTGQATMPMVATPVGWRVAARRWLRHNRVLWGAGVLSLVTAMAWGVFAFGGLPSGTPLNPTTTLTVTAAPSADTPRPSLTASLTPTPTETATLLPTATETVSALPSATARVVTQPPIVITVIQTVPVVNPPPTGAVLPTATSAAPPTQSVPPTEPPPATPTLAPIEPPTPTLAPNL